MDTNPRTAAAILWVALAMAGCLGTHDSNPPTGEGGPATEDGPPGALAWMRHQAAPAPRLEVAVAAVGADVYAIGGFGTDGVATRTVEIYDASRDRWSRAPDYPIPLHHSAAVAHDDSVYVLGGYTTSAFVPTALAFTHAAGDPSWRPIASLPEARGAHAAQALDGKLYVAGGVGADGKLLQTVHVYDPTSDQWTSAPDLPTPRDHLAAATVGGTLYIVGGRSQSLTSNTGVLEGFDPATQAWTRHADMPTARGGITAASFQDLLIVAGGEAPGGTFEQVESYDSSNDTWKRLPDLPTPRHGLGSAVANQRLYVVLGGPEPGFTVSDVVESLGPFEA